MSSTSKNGVSSVVQDISEKPKAPSEEWQIIKSFIDEWAELKEGQVAFILSKAWYDQWLAYANPEGEDPSTDPPPAIDNSNIIYKCSTTEYTHNQNIIKPKLQENQDFVVLPAMAWNTLAKWYGVNPKQTIKRKVIVEGKETTVSRVEIYFIPIRFSVVGSNGEPDESKTITVFEKKQTTLSEAQDFACSHLGISNNSVRLWNAVGKPYEPLWDSLSKTIAEIELVENQLLLFDKKVNGKWILKVPSTKTKLDRVKSVFSNVSSFFFASVNTIDRVTTQASIPSISGDRLKTPPGVCGLTNLGNTCFMNSALQCLSNAEPLTEYFISGKYKREINEDNPLGMKGNLAEQYAITINHMWSGSYRSVVPRNLKSVIGRFAPRFSGYSQQDAQEFLGFLLDGLHEDLNRIHKKPYIEVPDETGDRPDEIVAKEAWERHLKRNQSIIVELFQAQLKSTLVCPICSYVSVIFDPFMYLSLPLPVKHLYEAVLIDASFTKIPNKYGARLSNYCKVGDLLEQIQIQSGVKAENLFSVTVRNRRIIGIPRKGNNICELPRENPKHSDYFLSVFEVPEEYHKLQRIHVLHRKTYISRFKVLMKELIGSPLVMFIPSLTGRELYFLIWKRIQRLVRPEDQDERFFKNSNGKSSEECMQEDPKTIWEWIKVECKKDFDPEKLPVKLYKATTFGTGCACRGAGKCKCKIEGDDTIVQFDSKNCTLAVEWTNPEIYSTENGNTQIPSSSLLKLRAQQQKSIHLEDCLDLFSEAETLGENDKWYCPKCKDHVQAKKKMDLWSAPPILIIHLKRFSQQTRSKISTPVHFPLEGLDLDKFLLNPNEKCNKYDLFGISHHAGALNGGHYTATAQNSNGKWYYFNDSSVGPCQIPEKSSSTAYLLFYRRRTDAKKSARTIELGHEESTKSTEEIMNGLVSSQELPVHNSVIAHKE